MKLGLITHTFNEGLLLPHWIKHHVSIFDEVIVINHHSTDGSIRFIRDLAPHWRIVDSELEDFNAALTDVEVMKWEEELNTDFKITLNITEFLFTPNFKEKLKQRHTEFPDVQAFGMRSIVLVDREPFISGDPIWSTRTHGYLEFEENSPAPFRNWRTIHNQKNGQYSLGRHSTHLRPVQMVPEWLLLHFNYSPWPECIDRKLQIQTRIPQSDKNALLGVQHIIDRPGLEHKRLENLKHSYDLFTIPLYKQYYEEFLR